MTLINSAPYMFILGLLGLLFALGLYIVVKRYPEGNPLMKEIAESIQSGAMVFLRREYTFISVFIIIVFTVLWILFSIYTSLAFLLGAGCSMLAGFIGMKGSTRSAVRTTQGAIDHGAAKALTIAFQGGAVMGITVAALGVVGIGILYYFTKNSEIINGFAMGASSIALFARVGGGIYTKSADVGADLVGKVEAGIPEDDPRNPGVIADNVGDNVGDVGGLGADLLESFVGAIISVIVMVLYIFVGRNNPSLQGLIAKLGLSGGFEAGYTWVLLAPLVIVAGGLFSSLLAILYIRFSRREEGMQSVLMNGTRLAALLTAVTTFLFCYFSPLNLSIFYEVILGLVAGIGIGFFSEYFTSSSYKPTRELAKMNESGAAVGVTEGMALGMMSTFFPVILIAGATIGAYQLGGLLGVAFTAMGMLSFVGMTVAVDTYGPIADNAGGIATMSELPPEVRERTDKLDSIGNTTAAIGKGFAIGSAAFAALGLIAAFMWSAIGSADKVVQPQLPIVGQIAAQFSPSGSVIEVGAFVIAGLILGAMVPYVFSALLIRGVSRTSNLLVQEIRRQFKDNPKILTGEEMADYNRCISITAHGGLHKMFLPAMIAVLTPIVFGLIFGRYALGGFLIGALLSAIQLAIYCANAGGAMDNAKKYIEEGHHGGKNSEAHAAGVTGDTVGDPLKDTVGPSLDILIKLMSVIALVFASLFPLYPIFM